MELLLLDTRTLAFVACLGGFIMAGTMLGMYMSGTRQAGILEWAVGGFIFGFGYLVGHLLLTLPEFWPSLISGALANCLIGAGHVFILLGVQRYLGYKRWAWMLLVPVALFFVITVVVPQSQETLQLRIITHSGLYIVMDGFAGLMLWRARAPGLTVYRRAAATVLLTFALFLGLRMGYAFVSQALTTSFVQDPFQMLAFLVSMLFGFVLTMALVLMIFREKELRMREVARHDQLTGLKNRYALSEDVSGIYGAARENESPLALISMDLDYFKSVNDRYGHAGGDQVLKGISSKLVGELRDSDLIFRMGGEEFLIVLPGTGIGQALDIAERLQSLLERAEWQFGDAVIRITASFGVVEVKPKQETWDSALLRADHALYCAKDAGRNRVVTGKGSATEAHDSHKIFSC